VMLVLWLRHVIDVDACPARSVAAVSKAVADWSGQPLRIDVSDLRR
jgi:hypothetical protein